jgi:hypothetical protein
MTLLLLAPFRFRYFSFSAIFFSLLSSFCFHLLLLLLVLLCSIALISLVCRVSACRGQRMHFLRERERERERERGGPGEWGTLARSHTRSFAHRSHRRRRRRRRSRKKGTQCNAQLHIKAHRGRHKSRNDRAVGAGGGGEGKKVAGKRDGSLVGLVGRETRDRTADRQCNLVLLQQRLTR